MDKKYMNSFSSFVIIALITLFSSNLKAQGYLLGPTTAKVGELYTEYYLHGTSGYSNLYWSLNGSSPEPFSGMVSILFTTPGTNNIMVYYIDSYTYYTVASLSVQVEAVDLETPILVLNAHPDCFNVMGSYAILNYNPAFTYTLSYNDPGAWGYIDGNTVRGYEGTYTVTASYGGNVTAPSEIITINPQVGESSPAPFVDVIHQPTTTTSGSVELSGLPSNGSWVINPGNIYGTGTNKTITGLIADGSTIYNFTVTNSSGCTSLPSTDVLINSPVGVPTLSSVTQPTCTNSKGSFTITNYNPLYTYSVRPSTGVTISGSTVNAPGGVAYVVVATSSSGSSSFPSNVISVNSQSFTPPVATFGTITQPTAFTTTGSVILSGLPSTGSWIINPGNVSGTGTSKTITGLNVGVYNFTVTNSSGCISDATANVIINAYCGLSNENYVFTTVPQIATTSISSLTGAQKQESITYYDGLGRPKQVVGIQAGGNNKDIITHVGYDAFGRQSREYLPYTDGNDCGILRTGDIDLATKNYYTTQFPLDINALTPNPYSEKKFEASPMNLVLKQAAPGKDWALGSGHEIKLDYQSNMTADQVRHYKVVLTPSVVNSTITYEPVHQNTEPYYAEHELYKTVTYDENTIANPIPTAETSGSTIEFKNKEGQVVLKRTYGTVGTGITNERHDTYYVYDDYGNLTYVMPPKVNTQDGVSQTELDELCYQYKYDQRNRLVEKKLPGKQWEFIVYDKLDRVVATGPALSPFDDTGVGTVGWMITKYDNFNRSVLTGWLPTTVTSTTRISLQNTQNGYTTNFSEIKIATATNTTVNGVVFRYTNVAWPTSGYHILTVNYFDDYNYPNAPTIAANVEGQAVYFNTTVQPKGLPTGIWTRVLQSSTTYANELSYPLYDKKARPIRTYSTNSLGGYTYTDSNLDFTGKPEYTITYHKRLSTDAELKTKEVFTYSQQGRLLTQTHQINDGAVELIASNSYNGLGQLTSKKVGNNVNTPTQKVDYSYNIRGWLKEINDINSLTQNGAPKDLFAFKINYNTIPSGISGVNALYNGNIAETHWATNSDNGVVRTYGYQYDNLNRLRAGIYKKQSIVTNLYNESMDYDKNGNIMHLTRYGSLNDNAQTLIDNLTYNYANSNLSNQLASVDDTVANNSNFTNEFKNTTGNDYAYDANGNMISDGNKGITTISYNHLNLPTKITFGTAGNIVYIYNAAGQKVKKVVTQGSTTTTDYLAGYQYNNSILKFFPTAEGYVEPNGSSYKYKYQYKDHLGNVRLSYDKTLAIQEENNYYPFGLKQTGYNGGTLSTNDALKYRYNSKEYQDELGLNFYDFGFRNYDPALGRWMNIDPLAEKRHDLTTYNYVQNSPLFRFDPNGLTDFTLNKKTGDVKEVKKSDDPDRILKTNHKGEIKYNKKGEAKVAVGGIERGILKDGQNFKNKDQIINVGGEGQPSVGGVKDFTLKLSEYVGKEIKGFSYSSDSSGNVTDMVLGKYNDNLFDKSFGDVRELQKKYGDNYTNNNILQQFHTHPNGQLGATQSNPELSQDIKSLQGQKPLIPNASFIILYRITGQAKPAEYDYTSEYKP